MIKRILFFLCFTFSIMSAPTLAYSNTAPETCAAATTQATCPRGCKWTQTNETTGTCSQCPQNTFTTASGQTTCSPCPSPATSEAGAITCNCPTKSVAYGTWNPDLPTTTTECKYTDAKNLTCNDTNNKCSGYHKEGTGESTECEPNQQSCSTAAISYGFKFYTTNNWSTCYPTTCNNGYFLNNAKNPSDYCGHNVYEECTDSVECSTELGNCTATDGGTASIQGEITASGTSRNYSNCRCRKTNQSIPNGTGTVDCPRTSGTGDSTQWSTSCTTYEVKTCNKKYCETSAAPKACSLTPAGYYHDTDTTKNCQKCPMGSTTTGTGHDARTDCHLTPDTKFIDSNGNEFSLPINTTISLKE